MKSFLRPYLLGESSVPYLLTIGFPIIMSQMFETILIFMNRFFLAKIDPTFMSASLMGGVTAYLVMSLFLGLNNYVTVLVAQYSGAQQHDKPCQVVNQTLLLCLIEYLIMLSFIPIAIWSFKMAHHTPKQFELECVYFKLLTLLNLLDLVKTVFCGYFAGMRRTKIILYSNIVGLSITYVLNYLLILGKFGCPQLGVVGACYGNGIGMLVSLLILWIAYNRETKPSSFRFHWDASIVYKLFKYGFPSGIDMFLQVLAFTLLVGTFHSYGSEVATALTITMNWDFLATIPPCGLGSAVMSLVGYHMGKKNIQGARQTLYSSLSLTFLYSGFITIFFVFYPGMLANIFLHPLTHPPLPETKLLTIQLLRLAATYIIAWGVFNMVSYTLRGAGDTFWTMILVTGFDWLFTTTTLTLIKVFHVHPLTAWVVWICNPITLMITVIFRYRSNRWTSIRMVHTTEELSK